MVGGYVGSPKSTSGVSDEEIKDCIGESVGERISGKREFDKTSYICASTIIFLHINFQSINHSLSTCSSDILKPVEKDR